MVVGEPNINNIMSGLENTGNVKQHNHRKKLKQRFDLIKKLGQGTFGKVQLGINKETGQEVAIKTIKKSKIESEADLVRIRREIQIMSSVQHPNIIHIYEVFENREKMVLVMEYAAGGELYDYLSERKVLTEEEARRIFRQIATACYYCHKHKICHRDLKLENILLDENNNAKIADFGLSNVFDGTRLLNTFCGSPLYASPEIVEGTPYHGPEVDCWSLGVLLYTLVYGAMPFDGSNFKRLVRQISQGDYYEPSNPSRASPLIKEMLTVNPRKRANIEKICSHWWVNENYDENCFDISEELANRTPVRLDLLLSLAPPPQLDNEKLVITGEVSDEVAKSEATAPTRSQSVGSLMELTHPSNRRINELFLDEKISPKRKLESTVSTDRINLDKGLKRKDKIIKENTVADITVHGTIQEADSQDTNMTEPVPLDKSLTQTITKEMEVEPIEDPSLVGAACSEIMEEVSNKSRLKRNLTVTLTPKLENINETSQENIASINKENETNHNKIETPKEEILDDKATKKKVVKKKVLADKNENQKAKITPAPSEKEEPKSLNESEGSDSASAKPVERRRSRIFEAAEKFQNMMSPNESKTSISEKPKKIIIPGVSVDGFKKEFERKASLTSTSPPKLKTEQPKKAAVSEKTKSENEEITSAAAPRKSFVVSSEKANITEKLRNDEAIKAAAANLTEDRKEKVRNAVNIISSALDKEGARKSKSRPMMRKPPVPFGVSGRSASGNIGLISSSLIQPLGPKPFVRPQFDNKNEKNNEVHDVKQSTNALNDLTLKSATLPRPKVKNEVQENNIAQDKPTKAINYKSEAAHNIMAHPKLTTQRSEVVVPVGGRVSVHLRSSSVEPETANKPKERIIPISFEKESPTEAPLSPPVKPPTPKAFQAKNSNISIRSNSLSRQSTQDSDTETITSTGEPIKKSQREYIIPIAIEGGGYVTPRATSLEPSEPISTSSTRKSVFSKPKRFSSRVSDKDSEDESIFSNLHRHSSFGKDSDTEDSRREPFHMHRLRSTRPRKLKVEHADSISSGEDDDEDGFDILTAENLFSTLLSRVRDLTQRLNVEDGGRAGFPNSRFLSHFDHGTNFWNAHNRPDPFTRFSSLSRTFGRDSPSSFGNAPWRRSLSGDAQNINSQMGEKDAEQSLPRGEDSQNLNLSDIDLKKLELSDEDALALSYLTPGLTRRLKKQLLAELAPSEVRKLHRTLSSRNSSDNPYETKDSVCRRFNRRSVDRIPSVSNKNESLIKRSHLPVKSIHSRSLQEPKIYSRNRTEANIIHSPETSKSESLSSHLGTDSEISSRTYYTDGGLSSSSRPSYSSYGKHIPSADMSKVESLPSTRRISRFLRPDFYGTPLNNDPQSNYLKEKKERELETQKVLKQIRDKRKERLRERSMSKDKQSISCNESLTNEPTVMHEYVNVPKEETNGEIPNYVNVTADTINKKKNKISKLARPKSYPTEALTKPLQKSSPEKESKLEKLKKGFSSRPTKEKEVKNEINKSINEEDKIHKNKLLHSIEKKLERFRSSPSNKDSAVENTIRKLREQSLPKNLEPCTESGLIKRAVSVEDLQLIDEKPLQTSRKSVTKILGLFKKYEESDKSKAEKSVKKKKVKNKTIDSNKLETETELAADFVQIPVDTNLTNAESINTETSMNETSSKTIKKRTKSKLPVTSFRRSLNLESTLQKNDNIEQPEVTSNHHSEKKDLEKTEKKNLRLDFSKFPSNQAHHSDSGYKRNSFNHFAPDEMSDMWSTSSDAHSPLSPNGHTYSGEEESVIDRIRRKSFYTRFNEKKKPSYLKSYRDLDMYKDLGVRSHNYGSLDRRSFEYGKHRSSDVSNHSGSSSINRKEYKPVVKSTSLLNDYVNMPAQYQQHNSKLEGTSYDFNDYVEGYSPSKS